jgi:hypothetical protein
MAGYFGDAPHYTPRKNKSQVLDGVKGIVSSKLIARNTVQYTTEDGATVVRLHRTDIFRRNSNGDIILDTGGWNTGTTRDRMNDALRPYGASVHTHKGALYFHDESGDFEFKNRLVKIQGGILKGDICRGFDGDVPSYETVRPLVDRYLKILKRDGIPTDTAGDPFVWPDRENGKYAAHYVMNWLSDPDSGEPYIFGTFIYHAFRMAGATDIGIAYYIRDFNAGRNRRTVTSRVRRYIRACLGYAA